MNYHLPSHVSFGLLGDRAVALDLAADRYFLIAAPEAAALLAIGGAAEGRAHHSEIESLFRKNLLSHGAGMPVAPIVAETPTQSALEVESVKGSVPLAEVAWFRGMAAISLRLRGLQATLRRARGHKCEPVPKAGEGAERDAIALAQAFADQRLLLPASQLCVPDSLALARSLWRRGIAADIYFGVRLAPFMAHAWVQHGDMLLSDKLNTVAEYTPVFRL